MTSLAILTSKLEQLCDEVDDSDEIPQDLIERFADAQLSHAQKCDAYVAVINGLKHNGAYYSERSKQLARRAKTCERVEKAVKDRLLFLINASPGIVFKSTDGDKIAVRDNPEALQHDAKVYNRSFSNILDEVVTMSYTEMLEYIDVVTLNCLNTEKLKADLKAGKEISFARLTRGQSLRIS